MIGAPPNRLINASLSNTNRSRLVHKITRQRQRDSKRTSDTSTSHQDLNAGELGHDKRHDNVRPPRASEYSPQADESCPLRQSTAGSLLPRLMHQSLNKRPDNASRFCESKPIRSAALVRCKATRGLRVRLHALESNQSSMWRAWISPQDARPTGRSRSSRLRQPVVVPKKSATTLGGTLPVLPAR